MNPIETADDSLELLPFTELALIFELRSIRQIVSEIKESPLIKFDPPREQRFQKIENELQQLITDTFERGGS